MSKVITVRFSPEEYQELVNEAERKKITISAYIRSSTLMRISGDLIEKGITETEMTRRNVILKKLDDRGTF